ncbi:hypothetical protein EBM89_12035 [Cellulomonas triticagri]|uniref:Uncharacterized protein n=1 Tax=Cellulomonas triticagri TaxID=2483352 RepID=A0A3M2JBY1_9CELL|nr:hypothetical protein EBM89_12035 [Cellulomonas triticagri]
MIALGPVLVAAAITAAAVAVLWLVTLPAADPDGVCPAIYPGPWWCTEGQIRDRGVRLTQALLLTFGVVVLAATLLHRRWPRAAWLPVLALCRWRAGSPRSRRPPDGDAPGAPGARGRHSFPRSSVLTDDLVDDGRPRRTHDGPGTPRGAGPVVSCR